MNQTSVEDVATPSIYTDRSRVVEYWRCPRARYWRYEYDGTGIAPKSDAYELAFGSAVHEALAIIVKSPDDIEYAIKEAKDTIAALVTVTSFDQISLEEKRKEQLALIEGLLRGWIWTQLDMLQEEYEVVCVEQEMLYTYSIPPDYMSGTNPPLSFASKPDLVARRKVDGTLWYIEWKTTSWIDPRWFPQWQRAVQLMVSARGIREFLGEAATGAIVKALYKGSKRKDSGEQDSILCYGWKRLMPVGGWEYAAKRPQQWKGWTRFKVWEEFASMQEWLEKLGRETISGLYPQTPPIFIDESMADAASRQIHYQEMEVAYAMEAIAAGGDVIDHSALDVTFPQHFTECEPSIGRKCDYLDCCFIQHIGEDPLSYNYVRREAHHVSDPIYKKEGGE